MESNLDITYCPGDTTSTSKLYAKQCNIFCRIFMEYSTDTHTLIIVNPEYPSERKLHDAITVNNFADLYAALDQLAYTEYCIHIHCADSENPHIPYIRIIYDSRTPTICKLTYTHEHSTQAVLLPPSFRDLPDQYDAHTPFNQLIPRIFDIHNNHYAFQQDHRRTYFGPSYLCIHNNITDDQSITLYINISPHHSIPNRTRILLQCSIHGKYLHSITYIHDQQGCDVPLQRILQRTLAKFHQYKTDNISAHAYAETFRRLQYTLKHQRPKLHAAIAHAHRLYRIHYGHVPNNLAPYCVAAPSRIHPNV